MRKNIVKHTSEVKTEIMKAITNGERDEIAKQERYRIARNTISEGVQDIAQLYEL